ncbi:unnamed protein product [Anisakis simplex]|uniref:Protein aurora borealis n=1 Tax=Anisakis simplex TaxID=6269 RepID=A0A0M3KG23_ANISI|nr:unnamed protein product [Anisakis simplex]
MKSYSESSSPLTLNSFADYERNVQTSSVHRGRPFESVCELSTDSVAQQVKSIGDQENDKENEPVVDSSNQEQQHPGTSTPVKKASSNDSTETTRSTRLTNPFESHLLESLCVSTFSPRLFSDLKTPSKSNTESPEKFRWSIDQIAILNPADIDESAADKQESPDPVFEARVQGAIDKFWTSQKFVLPSPDVNLVFSAGASSTHSARSDRSPFQHPSYKRPQSFRRDSNRNNAVRIEESPLVRPGFQRFNGSILRRTKETQTLLTFPPDLDLVKLLGGRFQYNEEDENAEEAAFEANLSLNTLRRKLFADYDSSFSSAKDNELESSHTSFADCTANNPHSPALLKFDDDEVDEDEVDDLLNMDGDPNVQEESFMDGDISTIGERDRSVGNYGDDETPVYLGRRRMVSPEMSPIRFIN